VKTSEMLAMIEKNPALRFRDANGKVQDIRINIIGAIMHPDGSLAELNSSFMYADWIIIQKSVTWPEAVHAWVFGEKTIRCELNDVGKGTTSTVYKKSKGTLQDTFGCAPTREEIRNGVWYIEEDC